MRARLADSLRTAQDQGRCRRDIDVEALAREMIATLDGLHLQWLLDPGEVDLATAMQAWGTRVLEEVKP